MRSSKLILAVLASWCAPLPAPAPLGGQSSSDSVPTSMGRGCTTATMIDWDCDGYGPGSPLGPDADDNDPTVNTAAIFTAKYGSLAAGLAHLGYTPLRIWQISTAGSDAACSASGKACATLGHILPLLTPGDAVVWRTGTYALSATIQLVGGTARRPILYMAYPGEKVTLDWSAQASDGFHGDGQSYWTLDGIALKGSTNGYGLAEVQYPPVSNVTVRNVEITGFYDNVFFMNNMTNFLIERSVFHDVSSAGEHNLYIGSNPNKSSDLIIRNNIVYRAGPGGGHNLHLNGNFANALVEGNVFYAGLNQCIALQTGVNHSTFENNVCFTAFHTPVMIYEYYQNSNPSIVAHDQNYNVFRNNTFYYDGRNYMDGSSDCTQQLVWVRDDSGGKGSVSNPANVTHDLGHNTWDNNIFVNACGSPAAMLRYDTDSNGGGGAAWLATDRWRNNIFWPARGYTKAFFVQYNYAQSSYTSSSFSEFQAGNLGGSTNINSDPKLAAANPDWHNAPLNFKLWVHAGSPAIGAGLASDVSSTDIRGLLRGSSPDIGAYAAGRAGN